MKYNSLQINLKIPGAGGFYFIQVWGKPSQKSANFPDDPVAKQRDNLQQFFQEQDLHLKTLTQTHGNLVLGDFNNKYCGEPEADAFFTTDKSLAMTIKTADCIPILFYNQKSLKFGAIHSGWRGLHNQILSETLDKLYKSHPDQFGDFHFIVGPHIHTMNYETSEEVYSKFNPADAIPGTLNSKRFLNMEGILRNQFRQWQIPEKKINWINDNTYNSDRFFSHRSGDTGRNFNVIFYKEKDTL